ncbi:ferritin heavy chain-like isoform X2 [Carcharodon carcharias]|uniref:ferritin heavy chain-like isoform X2 n=1 Tax=Carcharodon carcharias TaxID=13397 RepID=UPI001B7E1245|nr:ferritin heavy chain-like isoform X2 [Carcharodon carcharias]
MKEDDLRGVLAQSYYFDRGDIALDNFTKFFKKHSDKEREQAEKLMKFQNQRGGHITLQDIKRPEQEDWDNGLSAMQCALQLEKNINQSLLELYKLSKDRSDPHLCDFLETQYLEKQVKTIKKLGSHITNLHRLGAPQNGTAEYLFNKHTLGVE